MMDFLNMDIHKTLKVAKIKLRPKTSAGIWVSFLMPLAILLPLVKTPEVLTHEYKLVTIASTGLIISNILFLVQCVKYKNFKTSTSFYISAVFTSFLFYTCLHKGIIFSSFSGFFTIFAFAKGLPSLLKTFPFCFTFGEAALVTQSAVLFIFSTIVNIFKSGYQTPVKITDISTLILQIGTTGLSIIAYLSYKFTFFRKAVPFYILTLSVVSVIIFTLHILLHTNPVLWILQLLTDKFRTVSVISFWVVCTIFAVIVVNKQIQKGRKANTIVRKAFHILAVLVYLTGLIDQCSVLYLASGIVFALFTALEMLRILNLPPLGEYLQDGFVVFSDEKDAGSVALTPLYLLAGCSIPIWIHPDVCDVTDSAGFNLLPLISGILSIGVGDTLASIIGTWIGKHRWPETSKTFEGTLGCIISQLTLAYVLIQSGYIINNSTNVIKTVTAIILISLIEAKTDQVDNIVLPLIMYIVLF